MITSKLLPFACGSISPIVHQRALACLGRGHESLIFSWVDNIWTKIETMPYLNLIKIFISLLPNPLALNLSVLDSNAICSFYSFYFIFFFFSETQMYSHWKFRVVMMAALLSLAALQVVVMISSWYLCYCKFSVMPTSFECCCWDSVFNYDITLRVIS